MKLGLIPGTDADSEAERARENYHTEKIGKVEAEQSGTQQSVIVEEEDQNRIQGDDQSREDPRASEEEMRVDRCEGRVECQVAARRLWRGGFMDAHECLPKAVPNALVRIDYEGPPLQPGSFRILHYHPKYAIRVSKENHLNYLVMSTKEKFLEFDHDSLKMKVEVVQGGYLGIMVKSYTYSIHIIEGALPDTCIAHWCFEYKALSPKHHLMLCARLNEVLPVSLKGIESYLLSNDEYQERA